MKNMKFSIKHTNYSVYESRDKKFLLIFFLFVTEFSNHIYSKNAVFNGEQKQMKWAIVSDT